VDATEDEGENKDSVTYLQRVPTLNIKDAIILHKRSRRDWWDATIDVDVPCRSSRSMHVSWGSRCLARS